MLGLLLLATTLATSAVAFDDFVLYGDDIPTPPPDTEWHFAVHEVDGIVVVRLDEDIVRAGYDYTHLEETIIAALADREDTYDFVVLMHTERLPRQIGVGAQAFHLAYNNLELQGTGARRTGKPAIPVRSVIWMNTLSSWDGYDDYYIDWVFSHEVSHYWLAKARLPWAPETDLLGRQTAHWSYWLNTPNSPIEGNAWIDNGDGTFTIDTRVAPVFSSLDLYLMGFTGPETVEDTFYIADPVDTVFLRESRPQHMVDHWYPDTAEPIVVEGTRVDVTLDDILAGNGPRRPVAGEAPTDFRLLPVLVLTPDEPLDPAQIERIKGFHQQWADAWSLHTKGLSTVSFDIEAPTPPPPPPADPLVPRGAW